jgi:hypothetical protein
MYRNGIFPHEVRRALEGHMKGIQGAARSPGKRATDPDIQSLLRPLCEKLDGSPRRRHRRRIDQ